MYQVLSRVKYYAAVVLFLVTSTILSVGPAVLSGQASAAASKVTICHATASNNNPYVQQSVDISSLSNGHGNSGINVGDIIPPTPGTDFVNGQNWDATGQSIWNNGCNVPQSVPVPATPAVNDPCGPANATWIQPANTASVTWTITNGHLVASTTTGNVFTDSTTTHDYGVAPDSNIACTPVPPSPVSIPATPSVTDPCGLGNATWIQPSNTASVTWMISNGHLVASTTTGYIFTDGTTTHDYGVAPDSGTACTPQKVFVCKYVGTPGVDERLQTGQNPIDVSVNAISQTPVVVGSYFNDAQGRSFVLAFDIGQATPSVSQCPAAAPTVITPGAVTFTDPNCILPTLGSYTIPTTAHVIYKVGSMVVTGTNNVTAPASVTVMAYPESSAYVLSGTATWSHTFAVANSCGGGTTINPNVSITNGACVQTGASAGTVTVTVNNQNLTPVTYGVSLSTLGSQSVVVAGGATGTVTFTGLAAGTYSAHITGSDDTSADTSNVTIATCPVVTPPNSSGHVLGASTTAVVTELSDTGAAILLPTIMAILTGATATGVMLSSRRHRKTSLWFSSQSQWQIP